jgi:hypothetical protein
MLDDWPEGYGMPAECSVAGAAPLEREVLARATGPVEREAEGVSAVSRRHAPRRDLTGANLGPARYAPARDVPRESSVR